MKKSNQDQPRLFQEPQDKLRDGYPVTTPTKKTRGEENKENFDRVRSKIEQSILDFMDSIGDGGQFHAEDLFVYITGRGISCAPDSPGRIMRALKREKVIDYFVVSRKESLYEKKGRK
jgi:hypothetical protein